MAHRLTLLTLLGLSGSLVALSSPHETFSTSPSRARAIVRDGDAANPPVLVNISKLPKTVEVNLTAAVTTLSLQPGVTSEVFAYNGHVPGPTLDVREGDHVIIHFRNNLPEPTTVHWHGIHLPVESDGSIDLHLFEKSIRPDTAIVSVMYANNETGVLFPIEEIAAICHSKGVLCHTDAVQTPGKLKIDVQSLGVDFLSLSAHKFHAPKGIGLLYVRRRTKFQPYLMGGHQEKDRRGGTENVPYIIGLGRAAELAMQHLDEKLTRVRELRDRMENAILTGIPNTSRNGTKDERLPNTSNIAFDFVEAEAILMMLDQVGICASSGSACTTGSLDPSHVLVAMGLSPARARGSVRFSLGIYNTDEDVDYLLQHLPSIIAKLRAVSPSAPLEVKTGRRESKAISADPGRRKEHKLRKEAA